MGDYLKHTVNALIKFSVAEKLSAAKLSAISSVFNNSILSLEKAIGDLTGEGMPYISTAPANKLVIPWFSGVTGSKQRLLDIVNLARIIGPASNLNPTSVTSSSKLVIETVPSGVLVYEVKAKNVDSIGVVAENSANLYEATEPSGIDATHYYREGSVFYFYRSTHPKTIRYIPVFDDLKNEAYQYAADNVAPDNNQVEAPGYGVGFTVSSVGDHYTVSLSSIDRTHAQVNRALTGTELDTEDPFYHHPYSLPVVLVGTPAGSIIPEGFLYLRNITTGEVYKRGVCKYVNQTSFDVYGIDLAASLAAGDLFGYITVGTDITSSIAALRKRANHTHDGTYGEGRIKFKDIVEPAPTPVASRAYCTKSERANNPLPQYLMRSGRFASDDNGINGNNIMHGDIHLGDSQTRPEDAGELSGGYSSLLTAGDIPNNELVKLGAYCWFANSSLKVWYTKGLLYLQDGILFRSSATTETNPAKYHTSIITLSEVTGPGPFAVPEEEDINFQDTANPMIYSISFSVVNTDRSPSTFYGTVYDGSVASQYAYFGMAYDTGAATGSRGSIFRVGSADSGQDYDITVTVLHN